MPDIKDLIPQRAPMLEVDSLTASTEADASTRLAVRQDNFFTDQDSLQEPGLIEHMAQSAAAFAGAATFLRGEAPHLGFIGEIKKCQIHALPRVGDTIDTHVELVSEAAGVSLVNITSRVGDKPVADCRMKIFLRDE